MADAEKLLVVTSSAHLLWEPLTHHRTIFIAMQINWPQSGTTLKSPKALDPTGHPWPGTTLGLPVLFSLCATWQLFVVLFLKKGEKC